jgi:hypothetical protein
MTLAEAVLVGDSDEVVVAEVLPPAPSDNDAEAAAAASGNSRAAVAPSASDEMARRARAEADKGGTRPAASGYAPARLPTPLPSAPAAAPSGAPFAGPAFATPPLAPSQAPPSSRATAIDASLPYGGDLQAAMRAQDRTAIRALMDLKRQRAESSAAESGARAATALPPLPPRPPPASALLVFDLPAVPSSARPQPEPQEGASEDDEIAQLEAKLAALKAAKAGGLHSV